MVPSPNELPGYLIFFFGLSLLKNILVNIEKIFGIFFTIKVILEFTVRSQSPAGGTNAESILYA